MGDTVLIFFLMGTFALLAIFVVYSRWTIEHRIKVIEEQCNLQIKDLQRQIDKLRKTS